MKRKTDVIYRSFLIMIEILHINIKDTTVLTESDLFFTVLLIFITSEMLFVTSC